jgi:ATP-dependent protease ClpP protease subunit
VKSRFQSLPFKCDLQRYTAVTELVVAELLFLNYEQADRPGYIYINSSGGELYKSHPVDP